MATDRLGSTGEAARQVGGIPGHHEIPRHAPTLCCGNTGDRPGDNAQSPGGNIISAATYSVLCGIPHKTDAATGEHGDLLDLIARTRGVDLRAALDEARAFLSLPQPCSPSDPAPSGSPEAARRLFRLGRPIPGTPAEAYLRARGITARLDWPYLRFHPAVWYRAHPDAPRQSWPALLAAVTDGRGVITGIQRCWLDRRHPAKAPLADPRRSLGHLLGNGVRFGTAAEVLAAGEGIETMLALKSVLPTLPMVAALSAGHLAALVFAPSLLRLYVVRDNDAAGHKAVERLSARGFTAGLDVRPLVPVAEDFNVDLLRFGPDRMRARLKDQLAPEDVRRFVAYPTA